MRAIIDSDILIDSKDFPTREPGIRVPYSV